MSLRSIPRGIGCVRSPFYFYYAPGFKPGAFLRSGQVQQLHSADLIAVQAEVIAPVEQVHDDLGFPAVGGITGKITLGRRREIG